MAQMSMNKVIHGAVRRDLARFAAALGAFTDGDTARAAALHRAWENFEWQLTHHHEGEHEIAWPGLIMLGVQESDIARFDDEHDAMAAALAEADVRMTALGTSSTRADADAAAAAIATLTDVTESHLANEERVTEQVYTENLDHPVLKDMSQKFGRAQPVKKAGAFLAWLQDGATADELASLRAGIPGPVLAIMTGVFGRRYKKEIAPVWS